MTHTVHPGRSIYYQSSVGKQVTYSNNNETCSEDSTYYDRLVKDCVSELKKKKSQFQIICFTEQQLNEIIEKCPYEIEWTEIKGYGYELKRK